MIKQKSLLIISIAIIILACFGFVDKAMAANYEEIGTSTSKNLLLDQEIGTVETIDEFSYNLSSIPPGTSVTVQFSQDNSTWTAEYSCDTPGGYLINLSEDLGLNWSGESFYYKMVFRSDGNNTPVLEQISVHYTLLPIICNSPAECDDLNFCTNDVCNDPGLPSSSCSYENKPEGTDCGDCCECQSGVSTYCDGTESSCECIADNCIDCSVNYGEGCGYMGKCNCGSDEMPEWSCAGGSCSCVCQFNSSCIACENHNVWGWAWSENVGWMCFSCAETMIVGSEGPDYGVDIDETSGVISGEAWSENIGWISFDRSETGAPPAAPDYLTHLAKVATTTGEITGWARALAGDGSIAAGDWDGWIKLSGTAQDGSPYGLSIDNNGEFHDWAWGGDDNDKEAVAGWVSFNCNNRDACGSSDYKVETSLIFIQPPTATDFKIETVTYCMATQKKGHIDFSWLYTSDSSYFQEEYKIAISTNVGFIGATEVFRNQSVNPGSRGTSGLNVLTLPTLLNLEIGYNDAYWLKIKVKDDQGNWSNDWSNTIQISTPLHAYPWPDFDLTPLNPSVGETASTTNSSKCFAGADNHEVPCDSSAWSWTISDGSFVNGTTATDEDVAVQFSKTGDNTLTLDVSDTVGTCSKEKIFEIRLPLPIWIETKPN